MSLQNHFIVCGLGSLGQHCVAALKEFGATVAGIEERMPGHWELPGLAERLDLMVRGDCRRTDVLEQAGIATCRAVLLVTTDEHTNIGAALAARSLNPTARLVVRSAQTNLNRLLAGQLGNFAAFDATQIPAPAFAFAALGSDTLGFFPLAGRWMRVVERRIGDDDERLGRPLHRLNSEEQRVLRHIPAAGPIPAHTFHAWDPEALLAAGDTLVCLETTAAASLAAVGERQPWRRRIGAMVRRWGGMLRGEGLRETWRRLWYGESRQGKRRVGAVYGSAVLLLLLAGTLLFAGYDPHNSLLDSFFATTILLLGGYSDVFGSLRATEPFPWWFQLIGLFLALSGIALVGLLYGLVTEALLSSKFQFAARRPALPTRDHVVVVGLGRVGQRVAAMLQEMGQPVLGVAVLPLAELALPPTLPHLGGPLEESLGRAHLETARSLVVATDEEMRNLEIGLAAHARHPQCRLVLRTFERQLSDHLARLLPYAEVMCAYSVAADAFAGAAYGESILGVFRLNRRSVLIAEYLVQSGDSLAGRLLAEVAYGFAVVPILLAPRGEAVRLLPADDHSLRPGDKVVFLATIDGLRRIEQGERSVAPLDWMLSIGASIDAEAGFQGANLLHRIAGLPLAEARARMANLPVAFSLPLYRYQAHRLESELRGLRLKVALQVVASA